MDTTGSLRLVIAAAGSVLIALARVAPADVIVTTVDPVSVTAGVAGSVPADLSQRWAPNR